MALIIYASNIHQGGGKTLLLSLISAIESPCTIFVDSRLPEHQKSNDQVNFIKVTPNLISRIKSEYHLKTISKEDDTILCFGNLPPILRNNGKVFVYLQNRYLCSNVKLNGFSWRIRIRIFIERLWLKYFLRNSHVLVQSQTMKKHAESYLNTNVTVMPFYPEQDSSDKDCSRRNIVFDYVYIASGEPHKNHLRLLEAWVILANYGLKPSLRLTLATKNKDTFLDELVEKKNQFGLNIHSELVPSDEIDMIYQQSGALIYPSFFESFGLPLIEAKRHGLAIIASEKDYVRDIVNPCQTFDPESALSIARAIMRHMNIDQSPRVLDTPSDFLKKLMH